MLPSWVTSRLTLTLPSSVVKVRVAVRFALVSLAATSYLNGVFAGSVAPGSRSGRSSLWVSASVLAVNQLSSLVSQSQVVSELTSTLRSVLALKSVIRTLSEILRLLPGTLSWVTVRVSTSPPVALVKVIVPVRAAPVSFAATA